MNIGQQAARLIAAGKTNEQVAKTIRAKNKGAKTTPNSVAWYRSKLRQDTPQKPTRKTQRTKH